MKFLIDAQRPPALCDFLMEQGCEAVHVGDVLRLDTSDEEIWHWAVEKQCCILSKDVDFANRVMVMQPNVPVIWIRSGNSSNRSLLNLLKPLWQDVVLRLEQGEIFIEVVK